MFNINESEVNENISNTSYQTQQDTGETKKKKKRFRPWMIVLLAVAIILTAISIPVAYALSRPTVKLLLALDKTLFSSKTINFDSEFGYDGEEDMGVTGDFVFGEDLDDTEFVIKIKDGNYTDKISLKDRELNLDGDEMDLNDALDDIEDELKREGITLDIGKLLNRVINGKLDRNELIKVLVEEVIPEFNDYSNHDFLVDTSKIDFDTFFTEFMVYLDEEDVDFFECKKVKSDKNREGKTYEYSFDVSSFIEHFYEYAVDRKEFKSFLDEYTKAYWDKPENRYYFYVDGYYTSAKDMKTKLLDSSAEAVEYYADEDIEFKGEFVIASGRLTYFEYEVDDFYGKIEIESAK